MKLNPNLKENLKRTTALLVSAAVFGTTLTPQAAIAAEKKAQARRGMNVTAGASSMMVNSASKGMKAVKEEPWASRLLADVDNSVNVRKEANSQSPIIGKLHKGDLAEVIDTEEGWYKITSGDVTGYVSKDYALVGSQARALAKKVCKLVARATTDGLRIREKADENARVLTVIGKTDVLEVMDKKPDEKGWIKVKYDGKAAYVSSDFVKVKRNYGRANTLEQEAEEIKKSFAEENGATAASAGGSQGDVYWLAAIASHEASTYEGQLAVAAVVLNRVRSSNFPNSISAVITAPRQFVGTGTISRIIQNGLSQQSLQAARAALAGQDPTGGCLYFWSSWTGHAGIHIGGNVFWR